MKSENIQKIILDIKENCNLSKRSVEDVILIGASKSQTIEKIIVAYEEGIKNFGENYLQEAEEKISGCMDETASNYNPNATNSDSESCTYEEINGIDPISIPHTEGCDNTNPIHCM